MWGIAFCADPRFWKLGKRDAYDDALNRVVGVWYCFGPVAITHDYE